MQREAAARFLARGDGSVRPQDRRTTTGAGKAASHGDRDKDPIDWPMLIACLFVAIGGAALLGLWVGAGCVVTWADVVAFAEAHQPAARAIECPRCKAAPYAACALGEG